MADEILKVYSPEQLADFTRDHTVIESGGEISDWNARSPQAVLTSGFCQVTSIIAASFHKALQTGLPIGLYTALKFERKNATLATGLFRFYRVPEITLEYQGTGTSCLLTITPSALTTTVTGGPGGEDLNIDLVPISNTSALVSVLNAAPYSATLDGSGTPAPSILYDYSAVEIKGAANHRAEPGYPIMLEPATAVSIPDNLILTREGINYRTLAPGTIALGAASSEQIAATAVETGPDGDMSARGIDTFDGKGAMTSVPAGVEHAVNDSAFVGGEDRESADERALRFKTRVQGLNSGTELGLETNSEALEQVRSASIRPFYPRAGFVTIVLDDGTGTLSAELIAEMRRLLDGDPDNLTEYPGIGTAGITYNLEAPNIVVVPVTMTIERVSSLSDLAELTAAVVAAVESYVNTRGLGTDIYRSRLISAAQNAHPAVEQVLLSAPAAQVPIDLGSLARTGTAYGSPVSVTVVTLDGPP